MTENVKISGAVGENIIQGKDPRHIAGLIWKAGEITLWVNGEATTVYTDKSDIPKIAKMLKEQIKAGEVEIGIETLEGEHPGEGTPATVGIATGVYISDDGTEIYIEGELLESETKLIEMNKKGLLSKRGFSVYGFMDYDEEKDEKGNITYKVKALQLPRVDIVRHPAVAESKLVNDIKEIDKKLVEATKMKKKVEAVVPNDPPNSGTTEKAWKAPTLADFTDKPWSELSDDEKRLIAQHYAWAPKMPPERFTDLRLPHHDPKSHDAVRQGVIAAYAAVMGARGGVDIPAADKDAVIAHLRRHYEEFGMEMEGSEVSDMKEEEMKTMDSKDEDMKQEEMQQKAAAETPDKVEATSASIEAVMAENKVLKAQVEAMKAELDKMKEEREMEKKMAEVKATVEATIADGKATPAMKEALIEAGMRLEMEQFKKLLGSMPEAWKKGESAEVPEKPEADMMQEYEKHKDVLKAAGIKPDDLKMAKDKISLVEDDM